MAAWETFDRALDLVANGQLPAAHAGAWRRTAEAIEGWIKANCWSETQRSYTMYPGTEALDASCLLAARMQYGDPAGERSIATIEALRRELGRGPLLYRYSGMPEEEGAFVPCSFWLVESLARAGRVDEAAELMDEMVALANDVGLFAEQMEPETGDFLGNVPQ